MDTSKKPCTIYIVRHGETEWNVAKRLQGQADSPLTEKGKDQAKALGELFDGIHFDAVFSSDLLRAKKTAEIITLEKKLAVITTTLLRERAFGSFEGKPFDALRDFDEVAEQLAQEERFSYKMHPEIESDEEVVTRLITFLRELAVRYAGKTILVVSHGAVLRAFLIHIGFGTYATLGFGSIKNTAYIRLETDGADFFIKETNGVTKNSEILH